MPSSFKLLCPETKDVGTRIFRTRSLEKVGKLSEEMALFEFLYLLIVVALIEAGNLCAVMF